MIPAYQVTPEDFMEVVFAISQTGPESKESEIKSFTNYSDRKIRESIKIGKELEMIRGTDNFDVHPSYRQKIGEVAIGDRDVLLNRALIQYRPFRTFAAYVRKGYPVNDAARKTNTIHDIASDSEYVTQYFEKLGSYAGLIESTEGSFEIQVESKEIPGDSVESVEALKNALESEAEIRFYLEETMGSEIVAQIDEDTEDELVKAFADHAIEPRDSITASGRALEDNLRDLGKASVSDQSKYESASGAGEIADLLKGDSIIRETHRKRAQALSNIRNKGGAHGDDQQTGDRWRTTAEAALSVAMETTLLIGSIAQLEENGNQVI